jgi:hypothetical protein
MNSTVACMLITLFPWMRVSRSVMRPHGAGTLLDSEISLLPCTPQLSISSFFFLAQINQYSTPEDFKKEKATSGKVCSRSAIQRTAVSNTTLPEGTVRVWIGWLRYRCCIVIYVMFTYCCSFMFCYEYALVVICPLFIVYMSGLIMIDDLDIKM